MNAIALDHFYNVARCDYRQYPEDAQTAYGPMVTCSKCGRRGAKDGARVIHVACIGVNEVRIAQRWCEGGAK